MHTSLHASALPARTLTLAAVLGGAALLPASAQTHVYTLNNTFADTNGGPSLVSNGGTLSASGYTFGKDLGLSLANVTNVTDYSITTTFSFSDLTSGNTYEKILDFQNLASDDGLYIYQSKLDFYPVTDASSTATFAIVSFGLLLAFGFGGALVAARKKKAVA